jgi:hypothetical protein
MRSSPVQLPSPTMRISSLLLPPRRLLARSTSEPPVPLFSPTVSPAPPLLFPARPGRPAHGPGIPRSPRRARSDGRGSVRRTSRPWCGDAARPRPARFGAYAPPRPMRGSARPSRRGPGTPAPGVAQPLPSPRRRDAARLTRPSARPWGSARGVSDADVLRAVRGSFASTARVPCGAVPAWSAPWRPSSPAARLR